MASQRKHKTKRRYHKERRITVRGVRRDPPDIKKLSKALISLAMAEAERDAQAEHTAVGTKPTRTSPDEPEQGGGADA